MQEVIARVVYDVDVATWACGPANAVEYRPQVEIRDDNSKPPTIGGKQRRSNARGRNTGCLDHSVRRFQFNRRDVNVASGKGLRLLEIIPIAITLEFRVGHRADCAACS